jgi:hypothetical protein
LLRLRGLQCVGVWVSTGFPCAYIGYTVDHMYTQFDFRKNRLAPVLSERKYCVTRVLCVVICYAEHSGRAVSE